MVVQVQILNAHVINLLKKDLRDLGRDFSSRGKLRKPFEKIRDEVIIPSIDKNFEVGGRVAGRRWEPVAPVTLERRRGAGGPPLTDTGQLRRAATAKARFTIRNNEMHFGSWPSRRWFGPIHDLEALARRADIPHRPFALFQTEDQNAIQEIMMDWVEDRVNANVRRHYG